MINLSYDELVLQIRKGNEEALELLFFKLEKYFKNYANKVRFEYKMAGFEKEDVYAILKAETINVINSYEMDRAAFYPFWDMVIQRVLMHIYYKQEDEFVYSRLGERNTKEEDILISIDHREERLLNDSYQRALTLVKNDIGTEMEQALYLWSQGYSYEEIEQILNCSHHHLAYLIRKGISYLQEKKDKI